MSDGHTGGFNTGIKVVRGKIMFVLGYLVEGEEASFWLHVKPPRTQPAGEFGVAHALKTLGFKRFNHCGLVSGACYYMNLRGRESVRPLAGVPVEAQFDKLVKELPGFITRIIAAGGDAESLGIKLQAL